MPSQTTKEELAEINAQRIALGLKPIEAEAVEDKGQGSSSAPAEEDQDAIAEANFARVRAEAKKDREAKALQDNIAKVKNRRELARKLEGKGLGEAEQADTKPQSAIAWLKSTKKKQKENAARRLQQQMEEEEAQVQAEYGQDDLAGLRVGHDFDEFDEGEERILTLRDARVLEDAEDELVDNVIAQREKDTLNEERRKGAKKYTGLDDEEFGTETAVGKKRGILSKYDAEDGEDALRANGDSGFRIGGPIVNKDEVKAKQAEEAARLANRTLLNLDYAKNVEVSDYLVEGEVGFKKSKGKKKKRSATKVKVGLDEDPDETSFATNGADVAMADTDGASSSAPRQRIVETDNFVDDDELQASLAKARRQKAKKTITKMTPEQIAANLAAQKAADEAEKTASAEVKMEVEDDADADSKPLTFDSTTEFVRNLAFRAAADEPRREIKQEAPEPEVATQGSSRDHEAQSESSTAAVLKVEPVAQETHPGADVDDDDMDLDDADMENLEVYAVAPDPATTENAAAEEDTTIEPLAGGSMAATLSLLRQQGLVKEYTPEDRDKEAKQREYDLWLAEKRRRDRLREQELAASKARGSAVDQATREYENRERDLVDAREAQKRFANYKPDVDIKYHDQHGRELSAKKAWKLLSHRFHGKAPGHKKQELEQRRLENERKREKMESGDTPSGMSKAFQDRSERTGQAHMVLSVGARGNAPQELSMLGPDIAKSARRAPAPAAAANSSAKGKGKGKASQRPELSAGVQSIGLQSFVPRHVGGSGLASVVPSARRNGTTSSSATPLPNTGEAHSNGGGASPAPTMRPAMKPAFAPIKRDGAGSASPAAAAAAASASSDAGPRFKLDLGAKRKADDAALDVGRDGKRRA
ncbi:hypothetical protein OC846_002641 [Tilletia horrida]|uniref:SART-1 protein n=1 Tax=Tilletia horrida TaxID=155126 RepID=A0AAN6JYR2_9BASI|nr:hypothetical protein OC846_002641 [Tilletia horrida]